MLEPLCLPAQPSAWPTFINNVVDRGIEQARDAITALKDGAQRTASEVLELWNVCDIALMNASSVGLFVEVHPHLAVRSTAEARMRDVGRVRAERRSDRAVYEALDAVDPSGLEPDARRTLERAVRDYRRTGIGRDADVRDKLTELGERADALSQEFFTAIRDDVRSIRIAPDRLGGLPHDFVDCHQPGDDGLVEVTSEHPDYDPFRTFARDADARRELFVRFHSRAWPHNDAVLAELLAVRHEHARLLGYDDWASFVAEDKMISSSAAIAEFIDRVADLAAPAARRDAEVLLTRKRRDDPDASVVDKSEVAYYTELVRKEQFDVDSHEVRRYFDFHKVRKGLLDVTGKLFGIEYRVADVATWHEEVAVFDVLCEGQRIGRVHLDLHPREGKFKHAAAAGLITGIAGTQLPEGVLVCNVGRGVLEHKDVVTLFHEFGHLMHQLFSGRRQRYARFSGEATEVDFVEAPSQLLEEWAWDAQVLRTFAVDADGRPIPEKLVERMRAARDFGNGSFVRSQMFLAMLAYRLHTEDHDDRAALMAALQERYEVFPNPPGTHAEASFGHLVGYGPAYYAYMWSLVIAKDLFTAFDSDNLLDPAIGVRYRDSILAPGGSRDAADLVAALLGRPCSFDAFEHWLLDPR
jgi:thimet oligopeptidase